MTSIFWISLILKHRNLKIYLAVGRSHELTKQPQWFVLSTATRWFFQKFYQTTNGSPRCLCSPVQIHSFEAIQKWEVVRHLTAFALRWPVVFVIFEYVPAYFGGTLLGWRGTGVTPVNTWPQATAMSIPYPLSRLTTINVPNSVLSCTQTSASVDHAEHVDPVMGRTMFGHYASRYTCTFHCNVCYNEVVQLREHTVARKNQTQNQLQEVIRTFVCKSAGTAPHPT